MGCSTDPRWRVTGADGSRVFFGGRLVARVGRGSVHRDSRTHCPRLAVGSLAHQARRRTAAKSLGSPNPAAQPVRPRARHVRKRHRRKSSGRGRYSGGIPCASCTRLSHPRCADAGNPALKPTAQYSRLCVIPRKVEVRAASSWVTQRGIVSWSTGHLPFTGPADCRRPNHFPCGRRPRHGVRVRRRTVPSRCHLRWPQQRARRRRRRPS